jgi:beta-galactosidase
MKSRRHFLAGSTGFLLAGAAEAAPNNAAPGNAQPPAGQGRLSLNGSWRFRLDRERDWKDVTVPHTWQVAPQTTEYYGVGWYERSFDVPAEWASGTVRLEFEAVFHSATVWVNESPAGEHLRKGYTAFALDVTPLLRFGERNTLRVRVDNHFDDAMLPRGDSSDWAHDGGIYRPVHLVATPQVFAERVEIDSAPDLATGKATLRARVLVRNTGKGAAEGSILLRVVDEDTNLVAIAKDAAARYSLQPGETAAIEIPPQVIENARLWHFDHPHLYKLHLRLSSGHTLEETFGIRKIETRDCGFYLNGERVRLMGVERMAGSNPEFGMAEPTSWIDHDHADMRELNCVYTRVHWQQDRRVLDYCDRHGILIQTEVPTWGAGTFAGMEREPSETIMRNGLDQLGEMIARDRNHPCLFSWGVCNEIGGQNAPAYGFAKRMYAEAKRLDPDRLVSYASNSLQTTPGKDVAGLMDFVMWNEYYGSWYPGTPADLAKNLDEIHQAFPGKAIVISEYGYCACRPERPEGDRERIEILRSHDRVFHDKDYVAGLIFFCYNDYRTHVGDKGTGAMKQRVHGVVDVYGARKPSFEALRSESSPIESLEVQRGPGGLGVTVRTRATVPSYTLTGYKLRAIVYGAANIPVEGVEADIPTLAPGHQAIVRLTLQEKAPQRVRCDVLRPDGCSASTAMWTA